MNTEIQRPKVKIAVIQMQSTACISDNLAQAGALIEQATKAECKLAVLPENFAVFSRDNLYEVAENEDQPGPILTFLSNTAKRHKIWIVAGTAPFNIGSEGELAPEKKVFPGCGVWNPNGECTVRYDKRHLFDVDVDDGIGRYCESDSFAPGKQVKVTETPWGRIGLSICYDLRFAEHFKTLSQMGAVMLTVPSAFTYLTGKAHWEILLRARAIENQCYVLAANQGGQHGNNKVTWGHSCIIDPWGDVIAEASESGAQVITAELNFSVLEKIRERMPVLRHRLS